MLSFGAKIKEARKSKNLTQKELARRIGAAHNSVSDWENDKNKPDPDTIELLCGVLEISPNYLLDVKTDGISPAERNLINKFRMLDKRGQDLVNFILDDQLYWAKQAKQAPLVPYPFAGYIAAAGKWVYVDADDVKDNYVYVKVKDGATFVFGVSGDSMEPEFYNGDLVYVHRTKELEFGDIGIFLIGSEYYIKEYGPDGLHSKNPNYPVMPGTPDIQVIGKVIGKVEE